MTRALAHRGPDQQGVWQSEDVSLGAVRLKVIDLHGGDQPLASEDGDTVVAFNGEIYNHAELRAELEARGHRFRCRCDTEVVLRAFLEWDTRCFARLRGMFATELWSQRGRRLVLARDRLGIKPLYFRRLGGDLCFGSELKALFEHPGVDRRLDLTGLNYYLSLNWVPWPHTLVEGIEKLPPGHWLEWRDGAVRSAPYWQLEFRPRAEWTIEAAKEELDGLLQQAVREHLVADVPLGVWASGGLDSSTILYYAARQRSRLKTFSVSFQGRKFDESRYFRQIAEQFGTEHHELDLNPEQDLEGAIESLAYYSDEPSADAGALPVWFLARLSREHVTVALSGEGADELFGGYLTYLADHRARLARRAPAALRRTALRALGWWPVSDEKIGFDYKLRRFLEGSLLDPETAHLYWNGTFSEAQKAALLRANGGAPLEELWARLPAGSERLGLNRYLWFDQLHYLPDDILYKTDRMSMAHSLEVRPPFLDHRIVEFAATLPVEHKIRAGRLKHVLRELMKDRLPAPIIHRPKEGFDIPAHDWLRGPLRRLLLDALSEEAIARSGLFHTGRLLRLVRDHLERRANLGYHLWGLLILFLWMRRWNVRAAEPSRDAKLAFTS